MAFLLRDLEDMRVGWQKVADRYSMTVFVFGYRSMEAVDEYIAVTNKAQGIGSLLFTIEPRTAAEEHKSAAGRFEIARCEPALEAGK